MCDLTKMCTPAAQMCQKPAAWTVKILDTKGPLTPSYFLQKLPHLGPHALPLLLPFVSVSLILFSTSVFTPRLASPLDLELLSTPRPALTPKPALTTPRLRSRQTPPPHHQVFHGTAASFLLKSPPQLLQNAPLLFAPFSSLLPSHFLLLPPLGM